MKRSQYLHFFVNEKIADKYQLKHRRMHRIFGQNQVTFELGRACLLYGKVYSYDTLIHSYINNWTIQFSKISWIYSVATEQLTPEKNDGCIKYSDSVYQIFGHNIINCLPSNNCKLIPCDNVFWTFNRYFNKFECFWTRGSLHIPI